MIKPGLNTVLAAKETSRPKTNNIEGLKQKYEELALKLSWIEKLDSVNKPAPLAPELGNYYFLSVFDFTHHDPLYRRPPTKGFREDRVSKSPHPLIFLLNLKCCAVEN